MSVSLATFEVYKYFHVLMDNYRTHIFGDELGSFLFGFRHGWLGEKVVHLLILLYFVLKCFIDLVLRIVRKDR